MSNDTSNKVHVFEKAGLGKAPFKCVRFEVRIFQACQGAPVQPGASCDFCATGIKNVYIIRGSDGREFKVGSDCVAKTGDKGLRRAVNELEAQARRAKVAEADRLVYVELQALMTDAAALATMATLPHPRAEQGAFFASQTFGDYAAWMWKNAGARGRKSLLSEIKKAVS